MATLVKKGEEPEAHSAVADGIVDAFLQSLANEEGLQGVAQRLREALLESRSYSDASLRKALFDEDVP